jgi:hypothetical protein
MEEPADCVVCHRRAIGLGIGSPQSPRWLCTECALIAEDIRAARRLDPFEVAALNDACAEGGGYLDDLDRTDLVTLSEHEFREFCRRVVLGFGASIRKQIREHRAPF